MEKLTPQTRSLIEKWSKTGLLDGIQTGSLEKAILIESQEKQLIDDWNVEKIEKVEIPENLKPLSERFGKAVDELHD
jgi:hypothetical protein